MKRRDLLGGAAGLATATALPRTGRTQARSTTRLRFVPQANLANPDPIWTTATVATNHGYMVWDTLYGIDDDQVGQPQMCAGSTVSSDQLTWVFTLRDGLLFHDGTPVRAIDCTTSITRWGTNNPFGQRLLAFTDEMKALDDKRFQIRLKNPFGQMLYALGSQGCFVMPERIARTPASVAIKEFVGSGPFRFVADQWVSGSRAEYAKFDKYVPRQEKPAFFSGGKVVHFDTVEWVIQPDPATAAAALQTGEVDWLEQPLTDLLPSLRSVHGLTVATYDPLGVVGIIAFNHLNPPFDKPEFLRALFPAIDQTDYLASVIGSQSALGKTGVGYYVLGSPYATDAGMQALMGKRDPAAAKAAIKAAGYQGEPIVLMSPTDQAPLQAMAQYTNSVFGNLGLDVKFESMDWGTLVGRRAQKTPVAQGGWSAFCTSWAGLQVSTPLSYPLSGAGTKAGWLGWLDDPKIEQLRTEWVSTPDPAEQKRLATAVQVEAFRSVPYIPTCQYFQPWAFRSTLTDFVHCPNVLFWNVRRV